METKELGKSVEEDESVAEPVKKKRMDARAYRALFKKQPKRVNAAGKMSFLFCPCSFMGSK